MDESDPKNYSKREVDHYFTDLFTRMDKQDFYLQEIKMQVTKTNGRVNKLEWWKSAFVWALGAMWTMTLIVVPLLYKAFYKDQDNRIHDAVAQALEDLATVEYEEEIQNNN